MTRERRPPNNTRLRLRILVEKSPYHSLTLRVGWFPAFLFSGGIRKSEIPQDKLHNRMRPRFEADETCLDGQNVSIEYFLLSRYRHERLVGESAVHLILNRQ